MEKRLPFTVYRVIIRGARVGRGVSGGGATRQIFARWAVCRVLDNTDDVGSPVGRNERRAWPRRARGRGQGISSTVVHRCRVERGVQSISRKSVCTARSPNAATLSSYSFDRNPLGLCTQSLMALFKDRYRSMETKSPEPPPPPRFSCKEEYFHASNDEVQRREKERVGGSFREKKRFSTRERALNRLRDNRRRVARRRIYIYIYTRLLAPTGARSRWQRSGGGKYVIRITVDPLSLPDTCVSWNDTWPIPVTRFTSPLPDYRYPSTTLLTRTF